MAIRVNYPFLSFVEICKSTVKMCCITSVKFKSDCQCYEQENWVHFGVCCGSEFHTIKNIFLSTPLGSLDNTPYI